MEQQKQFPKTGAEFTIKCNFSKLEREGVVKTKNGLVPWCVISAYLYAGKDSITGKNSYEYYTLSFMGDLATKVKDLAPRTYLHTSGKIVIEKWVDKETGKQRQKHAFKVYELIIGDNDKHSFEAEMKASVDTYTYAVQNNEAVESPELF